MSNRGRWRTVRDGGTTFTLCAGALLMLACAGKSNQVGLPAEASAGASGLDGGVSPGTASIVFTVAGTDSYCTTSNDCGSGLPAIEIDGFGSQGAGCGSVDCTTCSRFGCLQIICQNEMGVAVSGGQLEWDGAYSTQSTCGAGTACIGAAYAKPGRYVATMCATPGTLTGGDAGPVQCVPSGPQKCGHVAFDFPSATVVRGTIGP